MQVGVFTDPTLAKLLPVKTVRSINPLHLFPLANVYSRQLLLLKLKKTFLLSCTTEVSLDMLDQLSCLMIQSIQQSWQSLQKRVGVTPLLGLALMTLVISWRMYPYNFYFVVFFFGSDRFQVSEVVPLWTQQKQRICEPSFFYSFLLFFSSDIFRFSVYKDADLMDFINAPIGNTISC
jgi:hypothetical protein